MNIVIIEDEQLAYNRLARLIKEVAPDAEIYGPLECLAAAKAWFKDNPPPFLVFCDIHLADGSAIELLEEKVVTSPVIITSAYDQYALDTFNTNAIAYLLKPVKKEMLMEAMQKAERLGSMLGAKPTTNMVQPLAAKTAYKTRFMIRFGDHLKLLMVDDIAYLFTENRATLARTFSGRTFPVDQNLDAAEEALDPKQFFRLNRQYLINIKAIGEMRTYTKARVVVQLNPPVPDAPIVSSEKAADFKQWLADEL